MIKKSKSFGVKMSAIFLVLSITLPVICFSQNIKQLKNGYWRATIERPDHQEIVFNLQSKDSAGKKIFYVINGKEHLLVDSVEKRGDSVFIEMPFFESSFKVKITDDGNLAGNWIKKYGERVQTLPFNAVFNNNKERFKVSSQPVADISGKWLTTFISPNGDSSQIVAQFKQEGSHLSGTFLDPTGDYRFLDGIVSGDTLKLSTFDGAHAFLFIAKIADSNKISNGKFYSGAKSIQDWHAEKDQNASVPDGFGETKLRPGFQSLDFAFPDSKDSQIVSINDPKYKGKVVVVQILGSWCPNCMDETKFLSNYYDKNHLKGFEVIGLAYERTTDFKNSQEALAPFKKRLNVQYPVLITGVTVSDSLKAQKTLPQLSGINAFPTTIFIDKKGKVRKIESGFSGPATGIYYTEFKNKFNEIINELLSEK